MMDGKAMELLLTAAAAAAKMEQYAIDPKETKRLVIVDANGKSTVLHEPARRNHADCDLETLVDLAWRYAPHSSIWVGLDRVRMFTDDEQRRDVAALSLDQSTPMNWLGCLPAALPQRDLIHVLRTLLRDALIDAGQGLVQALRKVTWEREENRASEIGRGKASIGKSMREEIKGMDLVPEYVTFTVPVWDGLPYQARIEVALDPDESNQTFRLTPLPGHNHAAGLLAAAAQLKRDVREALAAHELADKDRMPEVYAGNPNYIGT